MPETYTSFVFGYLALWIVLMGSVGLLLYKVQKIKSQLKN